MSNPSGLKHQLVKQGTHFECSVCSQTWKSRPRTRCPGVRVYPRYDYSPLLTQNQLKYLSYETSPQYLPPPIGCYYAPGAAIHVFLYDPAQAVKRKTHITRRTTLVITDVYWPLSALSILNDMSKFMDQRKAQDYQQYVAMSHEIANIAAAFYAFTPAEVETFSGGCRHLSISPTLIHRFYSSSQFNTGEQIDLAARIITAYRHHTRATETKNSPSGDELQKTDTVMSEKLRRL